MNVFEIIKSIITLNLLLISRDRNETCILKEVLSLKREKNNIFFRLNVTQTKYWFLLKV